MKFAWSKKKLQIAELPKVREFFISVLEKVIWKNICIPNKLTFSLPMVGTKLAPKTIRLASRRTTLDRALDFASELAQMESASGIWNQEID